MGYHPCLLRRVMNRAGRDGVLETGHSLGEEYSSSHSKAASKMKDCPVKFTVDKETTGPWTLG